MTATAVGENSVITAGTDLEAENRRKVAILKAVGLDRAAPEQRELAIAIAKRYDLDLMLKHLVLIDGKPYVTRDALLWIAHRDGHLDGISVTRPVIEGDYYYCEATVYRTDMSHPFIYGGRYPVKGQNAKFAPEMATKVAESMALRRAFNISAPTQDERWDVDVPQSEPEQPKSLAEKVAEKATAIDPQSLPEAIRRRTEIEADATAIVEQVFEGEIVPEAPETAPEGASPLEQAMAAMPENIPAEKPEPAMTQCESKSPMTEVQCRKEQGHKGPHRDANESWT
jgi:hypothetical protein